MNGFLCSKQARYRNPFAAAALRNVRANVLLYLVALAFAAIFLSSYCGYIADASVWMARAGIGLLVTLSIIAVRTRDERKGPRPALAHVLYYVEVIDLDNRIIIARPCRITRQKRNANGITIYHLMPGSVSILCIDPKADMVHLQAFEIGDFFCWRPKPLTYEDPTKYKNIRLMLAQKAFRPARRAPRIMA